MEKMMSDECKHGSLRRSCEICERDVEIDRLRDENVELRDALRVIAVHALQAPGVDIGGVSDE